jgi:hypothetical protein
VALIKHHITLLPDDTTLCQQLNFLSSPANCCLLILHSSSQSFALLCCSPRALSKERAPQFDRPLSYLADSPLFCDNVQSASVTARPPPILVPSVIDLCTSLNRLTTVPTSPRGRPSLPSKHDPSRAVGPLTSNCIDARVPRHGLLIPRVKPQLLTGNRSA